MTPDQIRMAGSLVASVLSCDSEVAEAAVQRRLLYTNLEMDAAHLASYLRNPEISHLRTKAPADPDWRELSPEGRLAEMLTTGIVYAYHNWLRTHSQ